MLNWNAIIDNRHHCEHLQREAAAARLAASLRSESRYHPLAPVFAWTGRRLVTLGFTLLVRAREWEYRSNTVYNGAKSSAQTP
jgi:hypothetical protein